MLRKSLSAQLLQFNKPSTLQKYFKEEYNLKTNKTHALECHIF